MLRKIALLLFALILAGSTSYAATIQFSARQDVPTSFQHLTGIAVADFNGDGKLDIAVTDDYSQTIVVYLNDGAGTFSKSVSTTLNVSGIGGLGALVAGDVNEDGRQDLIVGPIAGNQVDIVLLGKGDGTFSQGEFVPGSYGFFHAALVDLNGDKHLDIVSADNGNMYEALGDGKGSFTQQPLQLSPPIPTSYTDLAVGDFNSDKALDIVSVGSPGGLFFLAGNSNGQFAPAVESSPAGVFYPGYVTSADFNGDGKLDLVVGGSDVALLIFGNGDGTFQSDQAHEVVLPVAYIPNAVAQPNQPPPVASGDMNGDGKVDVVVADNTTNLLNVLLNDGTGTFPQTRPDFSSPLDFGSGELRLADLNGDGLPDIVVTNYKTGKISIFLSIVPRAVATVTIQSSATQALVGGTVSITVQVKGPAATVPTGTVTLTSGSTPLGTQTLAVGTASFTLPQLAVGQYPLTVSYSGDSAFLPVANTSLTQSITDFQVSLPSATQTVQAGANATFPLNMAGLGGFSGPVSISCTGLPAGYTCSPTAATLTTNSTTVNVVVSPPPVSALAKGSSTLASRRSLTCLALTGLCFSFRKRRYVLGVTTCLLCLLLLTPVVGCSGTGTSKAPPYTGTSIFTISATATQGSLTASHQVTATLIVR